MPVVSVVVLPEPVVLIAGNGVTSTSGTDGLLLIPVLIALSSAIVVDILSCVFKEGDKVF